VVEASPKEYLVSRASVLRSPLLSLGCGHGGDELFLARSGLDVLATDADSGKLSSLAARAARENLLNPSTRQLDVTAGMTQEVACGSIYSGFLLHLLPIEAIRTTVVPYFHRLLRPSGVMLLVYRLIVPSGFCRNFRVIGEDAGSVEVLDAEKGTSSHVSIIDGDLLRDLSSSHFVVEDVVEYIEPQYNRLADNMVSETIGATLRPI
jgi:hypothetical protein